MRTLFEQKRSMVGMHAAVFLCLNPRSDRVEHAVSCVPAIRPLTDIARSCSDLLLGKETPVACAVLIFEAHVVVALLRELEIAHMYCGCI